MGGLLHGAELQDFGGAEVGDFHRVVTGEHNVRGLDVAMDDVAFVRVLQGAAGLLHNAQDAREREGVAGVDQRLHAFAFHQFHRDVVLTILFACVIDHNNVGMGEQAGRTRFGLEALQEFGPGQAGTFLAELNSLDRDGTTDDRVGGLVDHTHSATAKFADDFVTPGFRRSRHRCKAKGVAPAKSGFASAWFSKQRAEKARR